MKLKSIRAAAPLVILLAVVAGCGNSTQSAPLTNPTPPATPFPTLPPSTPATTPTPAPTLVVTGGTTAAIVNGVKVPVSTFRALLSLAQRQSTGQPGVTPQSLAKQTMDAIVADELVRQYAVAHGLTVPNAAVNARIQADEKQFQGKAGLVKKLATFGLTFDSYTALIRSSLQRHAVAAAVTPLMAAHVRHILIATAQHKPPRTDKAAKALARQIFGKVQHGANFASLARKYSDDPGSGKLGGDLGTFCTGLGQMVPQFDLASATLKPNHPALIHTTFGYHIIEVLARGLAQPGQCTQAGAPAGTPAPQPETTAAFQTWVKAQIAKAKIQRIAQVA